MLTDTLPFIRNKKSKTFNYKIKNYNRSIGANISGEIANIYGNNGFSKTPIHLLLEGTAGQSLGAWNAGGLNITLKTLLDNGDEVIIFAPYFVEYLFYVDNHGGKAVSIKTNKDFSLDFVSLNKALNEKTKAVIINSPNNP